MFRRTLLMATLAVSLSTVAHQAPAAPPVDSTFEVIHRFGGADGQFPNSNLVQARHGVLYGTTWSGGPSGEGVIFRLSLKGRYSIAHAFARERQGIEPRAGLIQAADGNFYGTTKQGGARFGTVFKLGPDGQFTQLHQFAGGPSDGSYPVEELLQASDGHFYGTTTSGGADDLGTVYRLSAAGAVSLVYSFKRGQGRAPSALIEARDGHFYGISNVGRDAVFRLTQAGDFEFVHLFSDEDSAGDVPAAPLIQAADGHFYGTTSMSPHGAGGVLFRLSPAGEYSVLHRWAYAFPRGSLVQVSNGDIYGATSEGGAYGDGSIYRLRASDLQVEKVHTFRDARGGSPTGGLVQASDGWLYGTTEIGGQHGQYGHGTVFRFKPK